ncbi:TPA: fimbria/pilus periplasmic chaperone [Klebsiella oxytoca]|nr:fimbria/pilus periplasmic chaperone [Klebsiella oxytoca]
MSIIKFFVCSFMMLFISNQAFASFRLEAMTVILDASEKRKSFNIKNESETPILVSVNVSDLDGLKAADHVMVFPPIVRIDPKQSQQVNFILKDGLNTSHEYILMASFQGVGLEKNNVTRMPIRQNIALLISPPTKITNSPWEKMSITQSKDTILFKNNGLQVIRFSPDIRLIPGNLHLHFDNAYLRPGETKTLSINNMRVEGVQFNMLSRYGFKTPNAVMIPVTHNQ